MHSFLFTLQNDVLAMSNTHPNLLAKTQTLGEDHHLGKPFNTVLGADISPADSKGSSPEFPFHVSPRASYFCFTTQFFALLEQDIWKLVLTSHTRKVSVQAVNSHKPRLLFMGLAMIWPQAGCIQLFSATACTVHSANQVVK